MIIMRGHGVCDELSVYSYLTFLLLSIFNLYVKLED